ncbi:MAG: alkaline phosphatase D family protein [Magnetococcales bacterium]|nr:alkaline phosphatase D family protein [Magnetococcales bacterium]
MIRSCCKPVGRRDFLRSLAAFAALLAWPRSAMANAVALNPTRSPFGLGVASGSPATDGFVLWTRLVGAEIPAHAAVRVDWELFELSSPRQMIAKGQTVALPELGHSVHVEVTGVAADRWYGYRFRVGEATSPPGRTRTLPTRETMPARLRFSYASCQHWENGFYAAYRHMQDEALDLVLFVGDYIYESASSQDPRAVRRHQLPTAGTLEDYRARYALYKSDPLLQAMHAQCPWLLTWDDHEVQNDYAGTHSIYGTENFFQLRAAGYQAYYEHMPLRPAAMLAGVEGLMQGKELRIYDRVVFGQLATFHLLDGRQYRDPPLCSHKARPETSGCRPANAAHSMLGMTQEHWLDESFKISAQQGSHWNIVVSQSRLTPANYHDGAGKNVTVDRWDGYPDARLRLLRALARHKPRNPLVIGGDIHQNWVAHVHQDPYNVRSPVIASEFIGTSISSRTGRTQEVATRHAARNPHCLLSNTEKRGYGVVELTPTRARVDLRVLDAVQDQNSPITTLATFVVEEGKAARRVAVRPG